MGPEQTLGVIGSRSHVSGPVFLWVRRALILLFIVVLLGAPVVWGMRGLGHWLVVSDPLEPARAVVVLGGHLPFRAMEAAAIYREGWAPEVWVMRMPRMAEDGALARVGLQIIREESYTQQVLERLGVPSRAIRLLDEGPQNTEQELRLVVRELGRLRGERVILVTSKAHSRRVRAIWRAVTGESHPAIIRYATEDPYNPSRWWRRTRDALAVSREVLGLMNVWAGFPVQPDRP